MSTRKLLAAGLGLRGVLPPVLTRAVVTAVLVAPVLWAHVETRIIGLADPASLKQTVPNGISVVSGSLTGVISRDKAATPSVPRIALSSLDREFSNLVTQVNSNSGGSGLSLLEGFKSFFASAPSFDSGSSGSERSRAGTLEASFARMQAVLGSNLLAAAGCGVPPSQFWSDASNANSALLPISEHRLAFDGEPGPRPNVATQYWTNPEVMPVVDMAPGIPAAPAFDSSYGGNAGWSSNSSSNPVAPTWSPPPTTALASDPVPSTLSPSLSYVPFHSTSLSNSPGVSTIAPGSTMPHISSGIVLASIPTIPTASANAFSAAVASSGTGISAVTPSASSANINYTFVPVTNIANTAFNATTQLGRVNYIYNIGQNDVTIGQYVTFLNAVGGSDPYQLYNTQMNDDPTIAGIAQAGNGTTIPYTYSAIGNPNRPITYVSWYDAARLANWMQNGQPIGLGEVAGSTETGAYTMNGANLNGTNNTVIINKNTGATVWIPTESEWFKAAYYDPTMNSGAGGYWTYATRSNAIPGNSTTAGGNMVNYYDTLTPYGGYAVTQSTASPDHSTNGTQNYLTSVGTMGSSSYYGTFDQSGLVYNWTDAVLGSTNRGSRGGAWWTNLSAIQDSAFDGGNVPSEEDYYTGIRLAGLFIPEPSAVCGLITGGALLLLRRRRSVA